jgi:hypothetical protein
MGMSAAAAAREHCRIETFHRRNLHSGRSSARANQKSEMRPADARDFWSIV